MFGNIWEIIRNNAFTSGNHRESTRKDWFTFGNFWENTRNIAFISGNDAEASENYWKITGKHANAPGKESVRYRNVRAGAGMYIEIIRKVCKNSGETYKLNRNSRKKEKRKDTKNKNIR